MSEKEQSKDKFLYHYTKLETLFEKILPSKLLRLGPINTTNDPRETQEWFFEIIRHNESDKMPNMIDNQYYKENLELSIKFSSEIKKGVKLLCFTKDDSKEVSSAFYGCGFQHPRMWAQYADNHRGVCIGFSSDKIINSAKKHLSKNGQFFFDSVEYKDKSRIDMGGPFQIYEHEIRSQGIASAAEQMVMKYYKRYFFRKHVDWLQEQEYRIVLRNNDECEVFLPIENCIEHIIIGCEFPNVYLPVIRKFSDSYGFHVGKLKWFNGLPNLTYFIDDDQVL